MSVTDPADEYEALLHVLMRVSYQFPSVAEDTLVDLIAGKVSRFGQVQLRDFVPVLVEGNIVRMLRASIPGERNAGQTRTLRAAREETDDGPILRSRSVCAFE